MALNESNKCEVNFRCCDTLIDRCIYRVENTREYKGSASETCNHQIGLRCNSAVAQVNMMTLKLKELME